MEEVDEEDESELPLPLLLLPLPLLLLLLPKFPTAANVLSNIAHATVILAAISTGLCSSPSTAKS